MTGLSDSFHRPVNYLRISVTDRCNLRCVYCMPPDGIPLMPHSDILTYEEIAQIARAAAALGISKVRLTGGEPLVRADLTSLVAMLKAVPGIDDISLTTNGLLLRRYAGEMKKAGLRRVNVSLDTLRAERFRSITRAGRLADVLDGIEAAREAGLTPIKTNTVVIRGTNDDEVLDFARLTLDGDWHVRFIEYMPFSDNGTAERYLVTVSEVKKRVETLGELEPAMPGGGPAKYFRLPGARGSIGFISPISDCFCAECNRLRLTADGKLRPCLFSDEEIDLRECLRGGGDIREVEELIKTAALRKPEKHRLVAGITCDRFMAQIGG
ncbi:MAG: GTP 3',8-cyclase MoaA [Dehalococcoidia bacterium]|nr:GTP 3',8-cyclase MoaA [Dehalococcoidia bacterium]